MSNIVPFQFENFQVRVTTDESGEPWFYAQDLAEVLEYSSTGAMNKIVDEEERKMTVFQNGTNYYNQSLISEAGLYQAIFNSTKAEAKRFRRWVTTEVLPSLRKTGSYSIGASQEVLKLQSDHSRLQRDYDQVRDDLRAVRDDLQWTKKKVEALEENLYAYDEGAVFVKVPDGYVLSQLAGWALAKQIPAKQYHSIMAKAGVRTVGVKHGRRVMIAYEINEAERARSEFLDSIGWTKERLTVEDCGAEWLN